MLGIYEIVGFIAGSFTTLAFVPQIIKVLKTKKTEDFSSLWLLMTLTGLSLWFVYGLAIQSQPVVLFNLLSIIFVTVIIFYKYSFQINPLKQK